MKFNEFVLKYKRILFISFAAAISFLLLCLIGFYFWLNYHTMAQVGDFKITRKVVLDNIASNRDYILTVKGKDANLEAETYQILLQKKAVEYEATKRGITVSSTDLDVEILDISTDGSAKTYYNTVAASYGWSKTDADSQVRTRMLKDKLESVIVGSYDVRNFYVRSNTEPKLGETAAQIKTKALELITKARQDAISGVSFQQIKDGVTASSATWTGDMTHGWGNVTGLNESNEADKLANGRFWPEIAKLSKSGDVTGVIDATNEGSLYVFWQLESKNTGTYKTMDEFYQSFQPRSAINEFLLKMTPSAYAACSNWLNDNVNTAGEIAWYRISNFKIYLREASTNAQITNRTSATVTMSNVEPATGHCDSTWCNMGQTKSIGTGSTIFYNSCCQFTYAISVNGMNGYTFNHVHRKGIEGGDDVTTQYPTHFNSINGIDNLYGYFDYNPIPIPIVKYTLTYVAGTGGTISGATSQTVASGGSGTAVTAVANTGYQFASPIWNDGKTTATPAARTETNVTANATYTASFVPTIIPPTTTLSYSCNGGTGNPPSSQQVTIDPNLTYGVTTVAGQGSCAKVCNAFSAWSIVGFSYQPGDIYHIFKDRTASAIWAPNQLTLGYNTNGGSGAPAAQTYVYGSAATVSSTVPTRAGYNFAGWYDNSGGTGNSYPAGFTFTMPCGQTLYAKWLPVTAPACLVTGSAAINASASATLSWTTNNATSTTSTSPSGWSGSTATSGSKVVSPTATTTYSMTATGAGGTSAPCSAVVTVNAPLSVDLVLPGNWNTGDLATYTTSGPGGTAAVQLEAYASDADAGETISMAISYQLAGSSTWQTSVPSFSGTTGVDGIFTQNLPAGDYWWLATASTTNPTDGTMTTPARLMHIADPSGPPSEPEVPEVPSISCTITPASGDSPLVVKVHTVPTGGAVGPYQYIMDFDNNPSIIEDSKPADFWYTYSTPGTYTIKANLETNPFTEWATCTVSATAASHITVTDPTTTNGGEVAR